jgi:beta-glucosidase
MTSVPLSQSAPAAAVRFPDEFKWGVASASYQIEGAVSEGGRLPSIWDTYSHTPGATRDGDTGDVADDHYHRWPEDVELLAELGVDMYRFSLAWPRVQPTGSGALNEAGVDFYSRLVDAQLERGIEPWITLYHWDLPQTLQDAGGWPERDTAARFAEYASLVYERLHDRVHYWTTLNEPWCSAFLGHAMGRHAPGIQDDDAALRAAHHLLLGHGLAVGAMRAQGDADSRFGITLNLYPVQPATDDPADVDAARRIDGLANRIFLDPVLLGRYPSDIPALPVQPGDAEIIAAPIDVLGVNYYSRHVVRAGDGSIGGDPTPWVGSGDVEFVSRGLPRTEMDWEIDEQGLHDVLTRVHRDYPAIPLYVTENGAAFPDEQAADGTVADPDRVAYLDSHFRAAHRAISDGVDLRGYFVWTLMDNFEWGHGYSKRFGLVHVDYETLKRTPKDSARWYAEVTRRNGLAE